MSGPWWRRRRDDPVDTPAAPPPPATPPPAQSGPPALATTPTGDLRRPPGPLSPQQERVWDVLERCPAPYPDPVGIFTLLERLADPTVDTPLALVELGRATTDGGPVRLLARDSRPDAGGVDLLPFVLVVRLDAEPPAVTPQVHVLTPDLDVAVVPRRSGGDRVAVLHPVGDPAAMTGAWWLVVLSGVDGDLVAALRDLLVRSEPSEEAAGIGRAMLGDVDVIPPGGPEPVPGPDAFAPDRFDCFPEVAVLGADPPPLPTPAWPPSSGPAPAVPLDAFDPDVRDPAVEGLAEVFGSQVAWPVVVAPEYSWAARLRCAPPPEWAVVRHLRLESGYRVREDRGRRLLLADEGTARLVATVLDVRSLPAEGILHHPISRLRLLHERLLSVAGLRPGAARWTTVLSHDFGLDELLDGAGRPAVLDELLDDWGRPAGFSVACDTGMSSSPISATGAADGSPLLVVVAGAADPLRSGALAHAERLARALWVRSGGDLNDPSADVWTWVRPPGWTAVEELELTTETTLVRVRLEPVPPGTTLEEWERDVADRSPFLRERRDHDRSTVTVDGLTAARVHVFDWQPSGRGRLLTTTCTGVADDPVDPVGFSLVTETDLESGTRPPNVRELLRWIGVGRTSAQRRPTPGSEGSGATGSEAPGPVADAPAPPPAPPSPAPLLPGVDVLERAVPVPPPPSESTPGLEGWPRAAGDAEAVPVLVPPPPDGDTVWVADLALWPGDDVHRGDRLATVVTAAGRALALTSPCTGIVDGFLRDEGQSRVAGKALLRVVPEPPHRYTAPDGGTTDAQREVWSALDPLLAETPHPRDLARRLRDLPGLVSRRDHALRWPDRDERRSHLMPSGHLRPVHVHVFGGGSLTGLLSDAGPLPPFVLLHAPSALESTAFLSAEARRAVRESDDPWLHVITPDVPTELGRRLLDPPDGSGTAPGGERRLVTTVRWRASASAVLVELDDPDARTLALVEGARRPPRG